MHRLIYSSTPPGRIARSDLREILVVSRARNEEAGITGRLVYSDAAFLQVLEGDEDQVRTTFARIGADPRHTGVRVLVDEAVADRRFGDWSMAFTHLDDMVDVVAGVAGLEAATTDAAAAEALLLRSPPSPPVPEGPPPT